MPKTETHDRGTGEKIGSAAGRGIGIAGGIMLGGAVGSVFVPGVGAVLVAGVLAAALLGTGGAAYWKSFPRNKRRLKQGAKQWTVLTRSDFETYGAAEVGLG